MFCGKCGAQNADNAKFCQKCGEKLESVAPVVNTGDGGVGVVPYKKKNQHLGLIAIGVVVILAVFFLFGGRSAKDTVNQFMEAVLDADVKEIFELVPDKVIDTVLEQEGYSRNELKLVIAELQDEMDETFEYAEAMFGDSLKMSHKIVGEVDVSADELLTIKDRYSEIGVKVKDAKAFDVDVVIEVMGMEENTSVTVYVIKVGSKWYIELETLEGLI